MDVAIRNGKTDAETMQALNKLLAVFQYSLASYLRFAKPWTHSGNSRLLECVRQIGDDHQAYVQEIGKLILNRRGMTNRSGFPTRFMAYNDLALNYLAKRLVEQERELIEEIARSVAGLGDDPEVRTLGNEVLAGEKQHLRTLTEIVAPSSPRNESHLVSSIAA
jgi:hypothetical protein